MSNEGKMSRTQSGIVNDGRWRAIQGNRKIVEDKALEIRAELKKEFADQLEQAGFLRRLLIRLRMRLELRLRRHELKESVAPRDGLY